MNQSSGRSLVETFDALALSGKTDKGTERKLLNSPPQGDRVNLVSKPVERENDHTAGSKWRKFVGGFDPVRLALNVKLDGTRRHPLASPSPNGGTVTMPVPQTSRTMQHALQTMETPRKPATAPRASFSPPIVPARSKSNTPASSRVISSPPKSSAPITPCETSPLSISVSCGPSRTVAPATPTRTRGRSASASATSSTAKSGSVQCNAITKAGKQCLRSVKPPLTHTGLDPIPAVYCTQHLKIVHSEPGCYINRNERGDQYVQFERYIPTYLKLDTQQALKVEMAKPPSIADGPGFIYVFEVLDSTADNPYLLQLKVGRAVNLQKRLDQWNKQCMSKDHIPRGWWPDTLEPDSDSDGTNGGLLRDHIITGEPGPLCHRVERLVHLELGDLSLYAPYLEPDWPDVADSDQSPSTASSVLSSAKRAPDHWCADCNIRHVEIFSFRRPENGRYKGREWDLIVKPVIEKWGKFVKEYYS